MRFRRRWYVPQLNGYGTGQSPSHRSSASPSSTARASTPEEDPIGGAGSCYSCSSPAAQRQALCPDPQQHSLPLGRGEGVLVLQGGDEQVHHAGHLPPRVRRVRPRIPPAGRVRQQPRGRAGVALLGHLMQLFDQLLLTLHPATLDSGG